MKNRLFIFWCIAIFIFTSCQKEPTVADGFGPSTKPLTGTPYPFPNGIRAPSYIMGNTNACSSTILFDCQAAGTLPFYMTLRNTNSVPITIIFPAGMVFPSSDTTYQGAVIVQPDTITVPPNDGICVNLNAECINETRTFNTSAFYGMPLISNNTNLTPLIQLLATKKTVTSDPNEVIQKAVWDIGNMGQMTQADITAINAFP
jgi:hypothetical protein